MGNLLFFASDYKIGLSSLLTDQLISLVHNDFPVIAVAGENEQEDGLAQKLKNKEIDIIRINGLDCHAHIYDLAKKISILIKDNNIRFVHVQNNWQLAIMAIAKFLILRDFDLKIIYTIHAFRNNKHIKALVARVVIGLALLLFANRIICMSKYLLSKFAFLKYKISLIPLGVSEDFFDNSLTDVPKEGLQMVFPAQFRFGKNQDLIIKAFSKFIFETKDVQSHLILPGTGEMLDKCKCLVRELHLENRVSFPGFCSKTDIKKMYLQSNMGIVASNCETFGQAIVEPFVLGRCVLSTHVGIADDILKEGVNGFFFSSEEDLLNIFEKIYKNLNIVSKIGENNFNNRMIFHWDSVSKSYFEMIKSL